MESKKKTYAQPYVEKVNFNYNDQVVASGGHEQCHWEGSMSHSLFGCVEITSDNWVMTS